MRILSKIVYFSHKTSYNIGKIYFRYVRPHISLIPIIFSLVWEIRTSLVLQSCSIYVAAPAAFVNAAAATDTDEVMGIYCFIDQSILSC